MMSKDIIYREDAIKSLDNAWINGTSLLDVNETIKQLNDLPSVDRPQGEWISIIEVNDFGETYQVGIYCSECGETFGHEANFCPYCGADMRENRE